MVKQTYLYRHFDKKGRLLYVGITFDVENRTKAHRNASEWAKNIHKTTVQIFERRIDAAIAELHAIDKEKPLHNVPPGSERERMRKMVDAVMLSARIPAELLSRLDVRCKAENVGRSDLVRILLERALAVDSA